MTLKKSIIVAVVIFLLCILVSGFYWNAPDITILYTADIHGQLGMEGEEGGLLKIASEIKKMKGRDFLLLDGGDALHGSFYAHFTKGEIVTQLMDECGYDAMVIGNHDFGCGSERLKQLDNSSKFQMLSATILKDSGEYFTQPYIIKKVNGLNVAIVGLSTQYIPHLTHPKHTKGLLFLNPETVARKIVENLQNKINFLILLTHLGYSQDIKLAHELPYDRDYVIIGGHSHTKLTYPKILHNSFNAKVFICHPGAFGEYIGKLSLWIKKGKITHFKHKLIYTADNKPYPSAILKNYNACIEQAHKPLFYVNRNYSEQHLAKILCEYMCKVTNSDFAILNLGTIRTELKSGVLTQQLLYKILPFEDELVYIFLDGTNLSKVLAQAQNVGYKTASLISFAGEKAIMPNKLYKVALSDFLAAGGDGYFHKEIDKVYPTGDLLRELLAQALCKKK